MVLTYPGEDMLNQMPYISTVLSPLPTVTFMGRDARIEPKCKVQFTVWSWFKDLGARKHLRASADPGDLSLEKAIVTEPVAGRSGQT